MIAPATTSIASRSRRTERTGAPPERSIYGSLGMTGNPFPLPHDGQGAGRAGQAGWVDIPGRAGVLAGARSWLGTAGSGPRLAVIAGEPGSGRTAFLHELTRRLERGDDGPAVSMIAPDDTRRRWSDRELLRAVIAGFGSEPVGRTGLELIAEARHQFQRLAAAGRLPVILIDDASLSGSQLEVLQSLVAADPAGSGAPDVRIILAGPPGLVDRVARRRTLRPLVGGVRTLEPLTEAAVADLLEMRIAPYRTAEPGSRGPFAFDGEAVALLAAHTAGNPGGIVRIAGVAMVEAVARNQRIIDRRMVLEITGGDPAAAWVARGGGMTPGRLLAASGERAGENTAVVQTRLDLGAVDTGSAVAPGRTLS